MLRGENDAFNLLVSRIRHGEDAGFENKGVDVLVADLGEFRLFLAEDGAADPPLLFVYDYTCDSHD
jgi:hypothetical protein